MMPLRRFAIHQPKTIAEASQMLGEFGDKGRLYAGGTELLLAMKHDLLRYEHLVDVKTIPDLNKIEIKNGALTIGSTATHRAIERSALVKQNLPVFAEMETKVANVRVRASGTLGGNLCFAEPHSDPATLLTALGAKAHIQGKSGNKTVAIDTLITGAYETSLAADELLAAIEIPALAKTQRAAYLKYQLKERPTLGLALVLDVDGDTIKKADRRRRQRQRRADTIRQNQLAYSPARDPKSKNNSLTPPKLSRKPPTLSMTSKAAPNTSDI